MSHAETNSTLKMLDERIAEIDALINLQLAEIIRHEDFQKLAAAWRGLHYLVSAALPSEHVKIKVIQATKADLLRDAERALDFDHTFLFKKVHDDIYGARRENPFGMLIGDFEFANEPTDLRLLDALSNVAAAIHAPFISSAAPEMFGCQSFSVINQIGNIADVFNRAEYQKWRSLRESVNALYVGLCLPRVWLRKADGETTIGNQGFQVNAAFAFGACVAIAYRDYGWCGNINGFGTDGALPEENFSRSADAVIEKKDKLISAGFILLGEDSATGETAFLNACSIRKPKLFDTEIANNQARLAVQLPYIFGVSRFAHYIKATVRDNSPYADYRDCMRKLNNWVLKYYESMFEPCERFRYPLADARIDLIELPGKPGCYSAVAFLMPYYRLDGLTISLRTEIVLGGTLKFYS